MASNEVEDTSSLAAALDEVSIEDMCSRHRKERKELQAKIQALKKNAPKKKRKEVLEEIALLENKMERRHTQELQSSQSERPTDVKELTTRAEQSQQPQQQQQEQQQRVSKAQKRRDKKSREAKEREEEIRAFQEECQNGPRALELETIVSILKKRQLMLHQIPSDGDCLYNAVRYQLMQEIGLDYTVTQLREETAKYIGANKESLIYYMTNPNTGDLLNDEEFISYCEKVRSTSAWGGQIELKALSCILKAPIEVLQAVGKPTLQGADEFAGPKLTITYHRHMYSLGEHYNATKPLVLEANDDEDSVA